VSKYPIILGARPGWICISASFPPWLPAPPRRSAAGPSPGPDAEPSHKRTHRGNSISYRVPVSSECCFHPWLCPFRLGFCSEELAMLMTLNRPAEAGAGARLVEEPRCDIGRMGNSSKDTERRLGPRLRAG